MDIGFTGTWRGMSLAQVHQFEKLLPILDAFRVGMGDGRHQLHVGCCRGADTQAATVAHKFKFKIIAHPGDNLDMTVILPIFTEILTSKPNLERNRDIVDVCSLLIATPRNLVNVNRGSGTWYTVRYSHRIGKPRIVLFPDGSVNTNIKLDEPINSVIARFIQQAPGGFRELF